MTDTDFSQSRSTQPEAVLGEFVIGCLWVGGDVRLCLSGGLGSD